MTRHVVVSLLAQADTRLTELEELAAGDGGTEQLIPDTLDTPWEQSGEGVRSLLTSYGSSGADEDVQVEPPPSPGPAWTSSFPCRDSCRGEHRDELLAAGHRVTDLDTEISAASGPVDGGPHHERQTSCSAARPIDLVSGLDRRELHPRGGAAAVGSGRLPASPSPRRSVSQGNVLPLPQPSLSPVSADEDRRDQGVP